MIARLQPNRVRRTYLGGGRIDAFTGVPGFAATANADEAKPVVPVSLPEDWLASTTTAFNGVLEIEGEGLGRLEDGRLVKDAVGSLPILVKLLDSDERLVIQAHPTVPCAKRLFLGGRQDRVLVFPSRHRAGRLRLPRLQAGRDAGDVAHGFPVAARAARYASPHPRCTRRLRVR